LRLSWEEGALEDLEAAATWSARQARAVVDAMEWMADGRWSLGRQTIDPDLRYWPVPPLGVVYRVIGDELIVAAVIDARRLRRLP
jgi:ParE toxin of type II toxin-antitoxin system, parDE